MVSITWKPINGGKGRIQFFRSKDKLEKELSKVRFDKKVNAWILETKAKKKVVSVECIAGVSYEDESEKMILQRYDLVGKNS